LGKWFPTFYDWMMRPLERRGFEEIRKKLVLKARGNVLEIGSGTGLNFPFYANAHNVTAIEPNSLMREKSASRLRKAPVLIAVISGNAEELTYLDNTFDCVVCTLVLCSVLNPSKALDEIRRVCKPNGQILLFEHVKVDQPVLSRIQGWLTPMWKRLCDGCHLNRNTLHLIKEKDFKITSIKRYYKNIFIVVEAINKKANID
jgi:ubiquinone/menaquinone biosynthesis C-methylase UbiE